MSESTVHSLKEAREETHKAVQLVGAFPRSFLPHDPSDASSSLIWNDQISGFESQEVNGMSVGLNLIDQSIIISKEGSIHKSIGTIGKTFDATLSALTASLEKLALQIEKFTSDLPYELPEEVVARGNPFAKQNDEALKRLVELYSFTNSILSEIFADVSEASDIRCWPHHYDLATLVTVEANEDPEEAKSIGFGFSPGDGGYDEPYFYLTPWPYPSTDRLYDIRKPAFWNTKGWTGGVLKALEIPAGSEKEIITDFFKTGFKKLKAIL